METVHATFDGARKAMEVREKWFKDNGYRVEESNGAYFEVYDAVQLLYIYRVSTKKIQE